MLAIIKYILKNAVRDRLYIGILLSLIIAFAISIFLGSTMLVEQKQTATVFIAGSTRLILAIGMILFVCLSINRAFENKEVEFILAKAISRQKFVMSYFIGFVLTFLLVYLPVILAVYLFCKVNLIGYLFWSLTLILEIILIIAFAVLVSLILKNPLNSIMSTFSFYMISRLMGMFVSAIVIPDNIEIAYRYWLPSALKMLSVIFPRLDLFAQSSWLINNNSYQSMITIIILQFVIYLLLLITMSFHDFKKKQF
jgi:ABC-type transport system involved in multi-copper enzyme maturation permease subunit